MEVTTRRNRFACHRTDRGFVLLYVHCASESTGRKDDTMDRIAASAERTSPTRVLVGVV